MDFKQSIFSTVFKILDLLIPDVSQRMLVFHFHLFQKFYRNLIKFHGILTCLGWKFEWNPRILL